MEQEVRITTKRTQNPTVPFFVYQKEPPGLYRRHGWKQNKFVIKYQQEGEIITIIHPRHNHK
jgi:hypothetical protein